MLWFNRNKTKLSFFSIARRVFNDLIFEWISSILEFCFGFLFGILCMTIFVIQSMTLVFCAVCAVYFLMYTYVYPTIIPMLNSVIPTQFCFNAEFSWYIDLFFIVFFFFCCLLIIFVIGRFFYRRVIHIFNKLAVASVEGTLMCTFAGRHFSFAWHVERVEYRFFDR